MTRVNPPTHCVRCNAALWARRGHEWDLCHDCSEKEAWMVVMSSPKSVRKSVAWLLKEYHDHLEGEGYDVIQLPAVSDTAHEQR